MNDNIPSNRQIDKGVHGNSFKLLKKLSKKNITRNSSDIFIFEEVYIDANPVMTVKLHPEIAGWVLNSERKDCMRCGTKFQFGNCHRHHCRLCGYLCCGSCSRKRLSILHPAFIAHRTLLQCGMQSYLRVCSSCYDLETSMPAEVHVNPGESDALNVSAITTDSVLPGSTATCNHTHDKEIDEGKHPNDISKLLLEDEQSPQSNQDSLTYSSLQPSPVHQIRDTFDFQKAVKDEGEMEDGAVNIEQKDGYVATVVREIERKESEREFYKKSSKSIFEVPRLQRKNFLKFRICQQSNIVVAKNINATFPSNNAECGMIGNVAASIREEDEDGESVHAYSPTDLDFIEPDIPEKQEMDQNCVSEAVMGFFSPSQNSYKGVSTATYTEEAHDVSESLDEDAVARNSTTTFQTCSAAVTLHDDNNDLSNSPTKHKAYTCHSPTDFYNYRGGTDLSCFEAVNDASENVSTRVSTIEKIYSIQENPLEKRRNEKQSIVNESASADDKVESPSLTGNIASELPKEILCCTPVTRDNIVNGVRRNGVWEAVCPSTGSTVLSCKSKTDSAAMSPFRTDPVICNGNESDRSSFKDTPPRPPCTVSPCQKWKSRQMVRLRQDSKVNNSKIRKRMSREEQSDETAIGTTSVSDDDSDAQAPIPDNINLSSMFSEEAKSTNDSRTPELFESSIRGSILNQSSRKDENARSERNTNVIRPIVDMKGNPTVDSNLHPAVWFRNHI